MSNTIEVHKEVYKSIPFSVAIAPLDKLNWGVSAGKFIIHGDLPISYKANYNNLVEAIDDVHSKIDEWVDAMPQDFEGWAKLVDNCLIWTGYEDAEIDHGLLKIVMDKYVEYRKTQD